jgi:chitinase
VPVLLGGPSGQSSSSNSVVTVSYATSNRSATAGVDYTAVSGTLSFAPGQTVKTVVVPIVDVGLKPLRRFALTLSNVNAAGSIADGTGIVTIGASPLPAVAQPSVSAPPDVVVGEGDGYVDLPVRLSAPGSSSVTVTYQTLSNPASEGTNCSSSNDYVEARSSNDGELTFAPGETAKVVRVQLLDCADVEGFISFRFSLLGTNGPSIARTTTLVSIVSNATFVPEPRLHIREATVDQKDGFVLVPVLLGGPAGQTPQSGVVTVDYATSDRSATGGVDYEPVSGTLSFVPGQTVKNVIVPILDVGAKPTRAFVVTSRTRRAAPRSPTPPASSRSVLARPSPWRCRPSPLRPISSSARPTATSTSPCGSPARGRTRCR